MNVNDGSEVCPTCHGGVPHGTIKLHAELNRLRGLIHSELLTTMHYCETCEMAYQRPEYSPVRGCPYCRLRAFEDTASQATSEDTKEKHGHG